MKKYFSIRTYLLLLTSAILFTLFSCAKEDPIVVTGNIEGTVSDVETDAAINGVLVHITANGDTTFSGNSKATGSDGKFSFVNLPAGSYKLSFQKDGYVDNSKNITLLASQTSSSDIGLTPIKPILSVLISELNFGENDNSLPFQITNTGKGSLNWEVTESIDWLEVNPQSGTTTSQTSPVTVTINRENLDPGNHQQTISVTSNGGTKNILIKVTIQGPKLEVTPPNLDFESDKNKLTLLISNTGVGSLSYTLSSDATWISSITPSSGNVAASETDAIEITINRNGLNYGNYTDKINVITSVGTIAIDVQMNIPDPNQPQLSISPPTINFGSSGITEALKITNSGNGTLDWNISDNQAWIDVDKNSGSLTSGESFDVVVSVNRTGLSPDNYSGYINVSSNVGTETCTIQMEILAEPVVSIEPDVLDFGHNEVTKTFTIKNLGTGNLDWTLSPNKEWISLSETSGTNQSTINVSVNRTNLENGIYSGQVSLTSNGGSANVIINIEKRNPNTPPVVDFAITPASGYLETNFALSITSSDDYTSVANLQSRWKWQDADAFSNWSTSNSDSHTYSTQGTKNITVEVRDEDNAIKTLTKSIEVTKNENPIASFTVTPTSGTLNTEFLVDANTSSDDFTAKENLQIRWQWEANTGFTSWTTVKTDMHTYPTVGNKTITLEVKDDGGLTSSTTQIVTLLDSEKEPNNTIEQAQIININSTILGTIQGSFTNVGSDVDYYTFTPTENGNFHFLIKNLNANSSFADESIGSCELYKYGESSVITAISNIAPAGTGISSTVSVTGGNKYLLKITPNNSNNVSYELTTVFQ